MVDTKISGLTAGTPGATDTFPFQRGGTANFSSTPQALGINTVYGQTVGTPLATDTALFQRGGTASYQNTFLNNIAGKIYSTNGTVYTVGTLTDTQYLQVSGGSIISSAVTSGASSNGWSAFTGTVTYVGAGTIGVGTADFSSLSVGDKLKLTQGTATLYQYISSLSGTIAVVSGGSDYVVGTAAITSPFFSHELTPVGFPQWFNFTATPTGMSGYTVAYFSIIGREVSVVFGANNKSVTSTTVITVPLPISTTFDLLLWWAAGYVWYVPSTYAFGRAYLDTTTMRLVKGMSHETWAGSETGVYITLNGKYRI